jgi:hypothetical protein
VRIYTRALGGAEISALASDPGHRLDGTLRGDWRHTHFGTAADSSVTDDLADHDFDGLPNLMEYALGGRPMIPDAGLWEVGISGDRLTLIFPRVADPALVYEVEAASSLGASMPPIWQSTGSQNTAGMVEVEDNQDFSNGNPRFMRLRITAP